MFFSRQHLHFAGIGGIGMSGIAEVLLNLGYTISGSDIRLSPTTARLSQLGATVYEGHDAKNVAGAKALVVSSAVDESNPEVQEARRLQIPVIPRGELLAELMRLKYGIAVALELGVQPEVIREGLKKFTGVGRRFEVRGEARGVTLIDDYGHHPTEVQATLEAARSVCKKRVHVLFQPHRYTRTMHLMDEFARAFHAADRVVMLDIYAASEQPIAGVTSEALVERMRQFGHRGVEYAGSSDAGVEKIVEGVEAGDMIVTLGAGSVSLLGDRILEKLRHA